MSIGIVFPSVARQANGIADHSVILANELANLGHKPVLIGATEEGPLGSIDYLNGWPSGNLRDTSHLLTVAKNLDVILVQFEQFSYGRRGYNPEFSGFLARLGKAAPKVRKVAYFHETFAAPSSPSHAVMHIYQRAQAARLAKTADTVIHSCQMGMARLGRYNPRSLTLPVHPNIPVTMRSDSASWPRTDRLELRVLVFGALERRRATMIRAAFSQISEENPSAVLWYIGKNSEDATRLTRDPASLRVWSAPAPSIVSQVMHEADIALSPFPDGVSGRRGSFAALMKHGLPTVTNFGKHTDDYLKLGAAVGAFAMSSDGDVASTAASLARSAGAREAMRETALEYFRFLPSPHASALAVQGAVDL
ncbi:glycosyltransferase family 4 protein [Microbacterium hydrothermale]|uniref:glycosyltransferase family 4 protein n=1 Tax=Microbacterium hydrothermale TaxID=857427 RepID=UPI0010A89DDE|nr:glycosyltransferase family 4 protein [Microbacterium hydrothermale]